MLPLFGRTRKEVPTVVGFNDEWIVPSDQELYGRSKVEVIEKQDSTIDNKSDTNSNVVFELKTVEEVSSECDESIQNSLSVINDASDDVIMSDIGESFADETFSVINNEQATTGICDEAVNIESDAFEIESVDDEMKSLIIRLNELERKFEELNLKVSKMETNCYNNDSNSTNKSSIFGNEFINAMQEIMKTGVSYQQRVVGKFIEELDQMFDFDLSDFDPFK